MAADATASSVTWNLEYDHRVSENLLLKINHLRRNGSHELVVEPRGEEGRSELVLESTGRSRYYETELTARIALNKSEFFLTYVNSRSEADWNDFDQFFGNFRNPIIRPNEFALTNTDTPHRFIFRGSFEIWGGWIISPFLEWRQGFPYSLVNEDQDFVGPRSQGGRFPQVAVFDLDVQKRIKIGKLNTRVGFRVVHIFNDFMPLDVQNNIDAALFGTFFNGINRTVGLNFQIDS